MTQKLRFYCSIWLLGTVLSTQMIHAQARDIELDYTRKDDNSVEISYKKKVPGSYYLRVYFPKLENAYQTIYEGTVRSNSGILMTLRPVNSDKGISFSSSYSYIQGVPNPEIDYSIHYALPFKNNKKVKILEASYLGETYYGGKKPKNWKSFLVYSKKADTVCSMRKGLVVKVVNKYGRNIDFQKEYSSERNRVIIEHDDGTCAVYKGFERNSIFVKPGQTVYPHTALGSMEMLNEESYQLSFTVYYLKNPDLIEKEKKNLRDYSGSSICVDPNFYTADGPQHLKSGNVYVSVFDDSVLFQELSKRQIKKYKKNPSLFQ
ncbi:MAG: hypothetical protein JSV73_07460 [Flavobacteriaceae bacterium]|nr:MAG: hypothetical protein JSV73_07460 [Flavobacteriaceae bacterium]